MVNGSTRRIVVIKDIPSNIIDEAILILKGEPGNTAAKGAKEISQKNVKRDNDYLMKEAELIINGYIKDGKVQQQGQEEEKLKLKKESLGRKFLTNTLINAALVGSIVLLIMLISRIV